jgi:hypothetical protein
VVRKTAVPGTRTTLPAADLMKISVGIAESERWARISCRPFAQVVRRMKATTPTSKGNQPPSGTLVRVALKKTRSTARNRMSRGTRRDGFQVHKDEIKAASRQVSISIAPVTATP